ncbi:hypothetical protein BaRGS_00003141 [Batillaria attramentaria]|uniref:Uncharacterized protein n=1 Tax=Batillaria attramentaria TaxID=370345 RepID=A0ABD0M2B4_9CAEN
MKGAAASVIYGVNQTAVKSALLDSFVALSPACKERQQQCTHTHPHAASTHLLGQGPTHLALKQILPQKITGSAHHLRQETQVGKQVGRRNHSGVSTNGDDPQQALHDKRNCDLHKNFTTTSSNIRTDKDACNCKVCRVQLSSARRVLAINSCLPSTSARPEKRQGVGVMRTASNSQ